MTVYSCLVRVVSPLPARLAAGGKWGNSGSDAASNPLRRGLAAAVCLRDYLRHNNPQREPHP